MFVIELTYEVALAEIDASRGLADAPIIEFRASQRAPDLPERFA